MFFGKASVLVEKESGSEIQNRHISMGKNENHEVTNELASSWMP